MHEILKCVGVDSDMDDRGRSAIKKSYIELGSLLKDFTAFTLIMKWLPEIYARALKGIGDEFISTEGALPKFIDSL